MIIFIVFAYQHRQIMWIINQVFLDGINRKYKRFIKFSFSKSSTDEIQSSQSAVPKAYVCISKVHSNTKYLI